MGNWSVVAAPWRCSCFVPPSIWPRGVTQTPGRHTGTGCGILVDDHPAGLGSPAGCLPPPSPSVVRWLQAVPPSGALGRQRRPLWAGPDGPAHARTRTALRPPAASSRRPQPGRPPSGCHPHHRPQARKAAAATSAAQRSRRFLHKPATAHRRWDADHQHLRPGRSPARGGVRRRLASRSWPACADSRRG